MNVQASAVRTVVADSAFCDRVLAVIRQCVQSARPAWDTLDVDIFTHLVEDEMNPREIADLLERPIGTIKYRIYNRINPVLKCAEGKLVSEVDRS